MAHGDAHTILRRRHLRGRPKHLGALRPELHLRSRPASRSRKRTADGADVANGVRGKRIVFGVRGANRGRTVSSSLFHHICQPTFGSRYRAPVIYA